MDTQSRQPLTRYALIDGNSFYCSCERALRPSLIGKPLIVLSNNDGCAIARSPEAKALGIHMGDPWFKIRHLQRRGLVAMSANFALYGDLSDRMMRIIGQFAPHQEIYSIDESFLDLTGLPGSGRDIGTAIRRRVGQWIGIPTCIGIGPSKTLAKLANHLAKQHPHLQGVCDLSGLPPARLMRAIRHVAVADVWGVGRRLAPKLHALGIHTAADLAQANHADLQKRFSIVLAQTAQELSGFACLGWEDHPPPRQQVICSRSFGRPVYDLPTLQQAIAVFTSRAAEKLRSQGSLAGAVHIFARTSYFRQAAPQAGSIVVPLARPTHSTPVLLAAVQQGVQQFYQHGVAYAKAGVCLLDITPAAPDRAQLELFPAPPKTTGGPHHANPQAMAVIDTLNARFGRSTVQFASTLHTPDAAWQMRQEHKSPHYTTQWSDLPQARC